MNGPALFYESWLDGLRDDVAAVGGAKEVGKLLRPELDVLKARQWVNDCLNEDRRERFTESQERLIIRKAREKRGFSGALFFLVDDTGFERPKSIDPVDARADLQRKFIEAAGMLEQISAQLKRLPGHDG